MKPRAKRIKAEIEGVRRVLNAWDPIGGGLCPSDEYDRLVDQIVSLLHRDGTEDGLRRFISAEFADHFGMPVAEADASRVAKQIFSWWERRGKQVDE